jgi:hypothetical protein
MLMLSKARWWVFVAAAWLMATPAGAVLTATGQGSFETPGEVKPEGEIDKLVFARLKQLNLPPAHLCSDAVFVRRAYLDVIGTLPTVQETSDFLLSREPKKRAALIDCLLAREEFADYWAMKWSDLLRVKAEFPINLWPNAAQAYHRWIRTAIRDNQPADQFARELLTASGSNFRDPPVNFYRAMQNREPQGIAQTVALTFLGTRAENWPKDRLAGLAVFFAQLGSKYTAEWKEEIIFFDPASTNVLATQPAIFPDGKKIQLTPDRDSRAAFADWLVGAKNPWFARNLANRVWSWLLGRGIVHEPDDFRPDNPPSNPKLLAFLETELVSSHYDLKHLYRLILNSKTYQLSSIPGSDDPQAAANFAHYPVRRLEAEVLIDTLCEVTGSTEKYSSTIPEPFTFIPEAQRSIALPDGSISSSFLELFGRPSRDTGLELERNNRPTAAQSLHLLNSSHIQRKIEQSRTVQNLAQSKTPPRDLINGVYLTTLSRYPTEEESKIVIARFESSAGNRREAAADFVWALVNSAEFLCRH